MVPVDAEAAAPGFERWVRKLGVAYVEPPVAVLERLVALRLHLDDCGYADGPLAVVPGSHRRGKLRGAAIGALDRASFLTCPAAAGDVLLMRPLLVHRSPSSRSAAGRKVLHVVYAAEQPGGGVRWRAHC